MAKTNDVDVALYSDDDWLALSPCPRWVYVWAFTNPRCNMAGLYKASPKVAALETGWSSDEVAAAFAELEAEGFLFYDPGERLLWVRSRVKHIRSQNKNVARSIVGALKDVPRDHPFAAAFYREYSDADWGRGEHRGCLADLLAEAVEERDDWLSANHLEPSTTVPQPFPNGSENVSKRSGAGAEVEVGGGDNGNSPSRARARARRKPVDPDALPADFPEQLVPLLDDIVVPALQRVAEAKGGLIVTRAAAARAVAGYPRKPHERIAPEFEHYWVHGDGQAVDRRDIVATYRRRLEQIPDRSGPIGLVPSPARATNADWVTQFNRTAPGKKGA